MSSCYRSAWHAFAPTSLTLKRAHLSWGAACLSRKGPSGIILQGPLLPSLDSQTRSEVKVDPAPTHPGKHARKVKVAEIYVFFFPPADKSRTHRLEGGTQTPNVFCRHLCLLPGTLPGCVPSHPLKSRVPTLMLPSKVPVHAWGGSVQDFSSCPG